jgi:hypothetical protein
MKLIKDTFKGWTMLRALRSTKELAAGFVAHISKPLSPTKFVEQVIDIVKGVPDLPALSS